MAPHSSTLFFSPIIFISWRLITLQYCSGSSSWGGRRERGSGWGTRVSPWLTHVSVWQKPLVLLPGKSHVEPGVL